jgi:hypothetical protein
MMNEGVYAASRCHQVSVAAHLCVPVRRGYLARCEPAISRRPVPGHRPDAALWRFWTVPKDQPQAPSCDSSMKWSAKILKSILSLCRRDQADKLNLQRPRRVSNGKRISQSPPE